MMNKSADGATLPTLEVICEICKGAGGKTDIDGDWFNCSGCHGAGYTLTQDGERVVSLMRHNFKPMLEDAQS
jgi:DnaJ-class molecular chaperone